VLGVIHIAGPGYACGATPQLLQPVLHGSQAETAGAQIVVVAHGSPRRAIQSKQRHPVALPASIATAVRISSLFIPQISHTKRTKSLSRNRHNQVLRPGRTEVSKGSGTGPKSEPAN